MNAATRLSAIVAEHAAARSAVGVTTTRRTIAPGSAPTRVDADRADSHQSARAARIAGERAGHAEVRRLRDRITACNVALRDADDERAARLSHLVQTLELRVSSLTDATFSRPAELEDWMPGGRFSRYARRFDLGFIGWSADDIAQEAYELVMREREAERADDGTLPASRIIGAPTATGSATAGHTIGEGYRAVKRAYRIGLGFYGYERRGTLVERDASPRGYAPVESDTLRLIRLRGEDESAIRLALMALQGDDEPPVSPDAAEHVEAVARRRRALETLTRRFPLNADGKMLALAALLAEGYTMGETCDALGVTERTAERWAGELARIGA